MNEIVLLGCGGHAKSVVDVLEAVGKYKIAGFVDAEYSEDFQYRGYRMLGDDSTLEQIYESGVHTAFICIGYMGKGSIREKLFHKIKEIGYEIPTVIDPSAIIAGDAYIGEGVYVGKGAVINSAAKVGRMTIINTGAVVEHDCTVGDFSHIAVNATLCGGASVGNHCLIGAGVTVIQEVLTGNNSVIGAGAVVISDIEENCVAVGVPAKVVKRIK